MKIKTFDTIDQIHKILWLSSQLAMASRKN